MKKLTLIGMLLASGCGEDGGGHDYVIPQYTPPRTITLLDDDFASGNLDNWTVSKPYVQASTYGNPAPSLLVYGVTSSAPAVATSKLSFSLSVYLKAESDVHPSDSNAVFAVMDAGNPAAYSTYASIIDSAVLYSIGGVTKAINYPGDDTFHRYTFEILPAGMAVWTRDGLVQHATAFTAPATLRLNLADLGTGTLGSRFDNILVTTR